MRALRILLSFAIVAVFSTAAMAVTVNLSIDGGSSTAYNLGSMSIASDGTISLNVTSTGGGGGGGCTNTAPAISVSGAPTTATAGTAVSATVSTSDANGNSVTVSSNYGSVSGSAWSWTPTTAGTYTITLTANDGQNCNNTAYTSFTLSVSSSGGGGTTPSGTNLPFQTKATGSLSGGQQAYYYFTPSTDMNTITFQMWGQTQWSGNTNVIISNVSQPDCSIVADSSGGYNGLWYNITGSANEVVYMSGNFPAGRALYATVCGRSTTSTSYTVYWSGY